MINVTKKVAPLVALIVADYLARGVTDKFFAVLTNERTVAAVGEAGAKLGNVGRKAGQAVADLVKQMFKSLR